MTKNINPNDIIIVSKDYFQQFCPDKNVEIKVSKLKSLVIIKGMEKMMQPKRIWTIEQEKVINTIQSDIYDLKIGVKANAEGIKANAEGIKANAEGIKANSIAIKQNSIGINKLLKHFNL